MIIWTNNEADYPDHSFLYVSKLGNDSNVGTKAAPLETINAAIAIAEADAGYVNEKIVIVIGEGVWLEVLSATRTKACKFIGSGAPIYDYSLFRFNCIGNDRIINGKIVNNTGVAFQRTSADIYIENCYINLIYDLRTSNVGYTLRYYLQNCVVDKFSYNNQTPANQTWFLAAENCVFGVIEFTRTTESFGFILGYFFNNIVIDYFRVDNWQSFPTSAALFNHNNFVSNEYYISATLYVLLEHSHFIGSGRNINSFSADPEFNNEALGDYSLKETSPCLLAGLNRASIGAYNRGWPHYSFTEIFRSVIGAVYSESYFGGILEQDIVGDVDAGSFELESGHHAGTVISAIGTLSAPQRIDRIESLIDFGTDVNGYHTNLPVWSDFLFAAYNNARKYFEGDTITEGGVKYICIQDYPNESPFVEYPPASSATYWAVSTIPTSTNVVPNFLFRYGNSLTEVNEAAWKLMPFKGDFKVDENGKGSADPDYDAATGGYITFSRYQFKLKLKNL